MGFRSFRGSYRVKFLQGGFYMEIRQSAEDYLESILVISKKGGGVRSIDIATRTWCFQAKRQSRN